MLNLSLINSVNTVEVNDDFTMLWILLSGILVFFMQAGFTLLEVGTVRAKNTINIIVKLVGSTGNKATVIPTAHYYTCLFRISIFYSNFPFFPNFIVVADCLI